MRKNYLLVLLICLLVFQFNFLKSQSAIIIGGQAGSNISSNFAGPMFSSLAANSYSRNAMIYPQVLLGQLKHGDSIFSLSFLKNGNGFISGTSNFKIYIRTTVNNRYIGGTQNWSNLSSSTGMTLVYDNSPNNIIGNTPGWKRFEFTTPYVVDTSLGKNLEILTEYFHTQSQTSNVFWTFNANLQGNDINQNKFYRGSSSFNNILSDSTFVRPALRINLTKRENYVSLEKVYSLGKLPVPIGNPDTVKALIRNHGTHDAKNVKIILRSKGKNNIIDSAYYDLNFGEEKLVNLPSLFPQNLGIDTLETILIDSSFSAPKRLNVIRLCTENIFSYRDITLPIAGGIGFNGTTGDFVAKFFSNTPKAINQVSVSFAVANQRFRLGIWDMDSLTGLPNNNIWTSDTLISSANFIAQVKPALSVNGNFFVGVRQIETRNVAFAYQPENPVRPQTFLFTSPSGNTVWTDFAPDAPFKFMIEPRIQAQNDVAVLSLVQPKDTVDLTSVKTIAPKARIINYGSNHQLTAFTTRMEIRRNGNLVYTSNIQDTLSSGKERILTFDSSFLPVIAGTYNVLIFTRLGIDQMKDNDTLRKNIVVAKYRDVGLGSVFDPNSSFDYEQFVDTIYPTIFVQNFGLDNVNNFNVTAQIFDSLNNQLFNETKQYSLTGLNSVLASFNPFPCRQKGKYFFRAFTSYNLDSDRKNDTAKRTFNVIRSNDVGVLSVVYPENQKSLTPPVASKKPQILVGNFGDANQDDYFKVHCEIYYKNNLIYKDSNITNCYRNAPENVFFKNFQPTQLGYYQMKSFTSLEIDQLRTNDTLFTTFAVGVPDDVKIINIFPVQNAGLQIGEVFAPKARFTNTGFFPQNDSFPVVFKVSQGNSVRYFSSRKITLDSGESKTVVFDSTLSLNLNETYQVEVFSDLDIDFVKSNDSIITNYFGKKNYDVGIVSINYPKMSDTLLVGQTLAKPLVEIANLGDSLSNKSFTVSLKVFNQINNQLIYSQDVDTSFSSYSNMLLQFPEIPIQMTEKKVVLEAILFYGKDQFSNNNFLRDSSKYHILNDLEVVDVLNPKTNAKYNIISVAVTPSVEIRNNAATQKDYSLNYKINWVDSINNSEVTVFEDSIKNILLGKEIKTVLMTKDFEFSNKNVGKYKSYITISSDKDQITENNFYESNFRIQEYVNIDKIEIGQIQVYPNPVQENLIISVQNLLENQEFVIYNSIGKMVFKGTINNHQTVLNVSNLNNGVYLIQINGQNIKFIVSH